MDGYREGCKSSRLNTNSKSEFYDIFEKNGYKNSFKTLYFAKSIGEK